MFHSITWQQYIIFISISLLVYYMYIVLRYYNNGFSNFIKRNKNITVDFEEKHDKTIGSEDTTFNNLIEELKILFQLASKRKFPKEELMIALQLKLKEYSQFKNTSLEIAVNNFLASESDNQCSIHLSEEDQRVLWFG